MLSFKQFKQQIDENIPDCTYEDGLTTDQKSDQQSSKQDDSNNEDEQQEEDDG